MTSISSLAHHRDARSASCEHVHDTTTRYDRAEKLLSFVLVCPVCKTEKLLHTIPYEPRSEPQRASEPAGATVHQLRTRAPGHRDRRAA